MNAGINKVLSTARTVRDIIRRHDSAVGDWRTGTMCGSPGSFMLSVKK